MRIFDLSGLRYPWQGAIPTMHEDGAQLRAAQSSLGLAGVQDLVMAALAAMDMLRLSEVRIAQRLDIPPELLERWRQVQWREAKAFLETDPDDYYTQQISELRQQLRVATSKANPAAGQKAWKGASQEARMLRRDIHALMLEAGKLERPAPDPAEGDDKGAHLKTARELIQGVNETLAGVFQAVAPASPKILDMGRDAGFAHLTEIMRGESEIDESLIGEPMEFTEGSIEEQRQDRLLYIANNPDQPVPPEVDPDDPTGWVPAVQTGRRERARKEARGLVSDYEIPGLDGPMDGFNGGHLPLDVTPVVEWLRANPEPEAA